MNNIFINRKIMKKISTLLMFTLLLFLNSSCDDGKEKVSTSNSVNSSEIVTGDTAQSSVLETGEDTSRPDPFTADRYYTFLFMEQDINYDSVLKMVEMNNKYSASKRTKEDLNELNTQILEIKNEANKKRSQLFNQFGITPDQLTTISTNQTAMKEREVYLQLHHKTRERLTQHQTRQKEIQAMYASIQNH